MEISIHALLAESDRFGCLKQRRIDISIHALLAESDHDSYVVMEATKIISIHALLAESDSKEVTMADFDKVFLSTLSLRRATVSLMLYDTSSLIFLSTLSLRRATGRLVYQLLVIGISIHALLAESDRIVGGILLVTRYFYPRSPCGERRLHPFCAPP